MIFRLLVVEFQGVFIGVSVYVCYLWFVGTGLITLGEGLVVGIQPI